MPKSRETTPIERSAIVALHSEGVSLNKLARRYGFDRRTIMRICSRHRQSGVVDNLPRCGRSRATTVREDRVLHRIQRQSPMASSSCVALTFQQQTGKGISASTIRRRMISFGLKSCIALKKPMISAVNKKKRLYWARLHRH
jgi:transposase